MTTRPDATLSGLLHKWTSDRSRVHLLRSADQPAYEWRRGDERSFSWRSGHRARAPVVRHVQPWRHRGVRERFAGGLHPRTSPVLRSPNTDGSPGDRTRWHSIRRSLISSLPSTTSSGKTTGLRYGSPSVARTVERSSICRRPAARSPSRASRRGRSGSRRTRMRAGRCTPPVVAGLPSDPTPPDRIPRKGITRRSPEHIPSARCRCREHAGAPNRECCEVPPTPRSDLRVRSTRR
jgi:hypothetical protein